MVAQWYDRFGSISGRQRIREWPKVPPEQRLQRWFEKTVKKSAFMRKQKPETFLLLKTSIAKDIGLATAEVTIVVCQLTTELRSPEREHPLAVLRNT